MPLEIRLAYDKLDEVKALFNEYTASLGVELDFQDYENELENLPGKYSLPGGRLYLADCDGEVAGCIALRPLKGENQGCEMKRMFVRPQFRGLKIGKALAERVIAEAKEIGYGYMVLDSLPTMKNAIHMYGTLGFYEIEPYCFNPVEGTTFLRLDL